MASEKTQVIEWLFFNRKYDATTGVLSQAVVTMDDLVEGIAATGAKLSTVNVANFWKDLTRDGARGSTGTGPERCSPADMRAATQSVRWIKPFSCSCP
ncbi:hypothetical protein [Rathayibacter toxicus]|uniref:hypothetical protein n=1 Tax=Rathayibacter toxicus TaxID=145458 RepID=UPI0011B09DDE|nr:hypothetical protein [Rathayibacter toxicus]QOD11320.1 hypothetical protein BSG36_05130 [Rathayibacter toxicus]QWL28062.1 hypothetical protein E2R33_05135 [Rathayibacter toxicus]QWL32261.1 hypothetical protein E2R35_05000 [Rathayibacter toxicus]QWL34354.1 hypothetical protein E2R36_05000 [Rathayibacter toxicus]QWL36486.1 hypothetical protein E2R37_04995 [Rathayibacter toxicus]